MSIPLSIFQADSGHWPLLQKRGTRSPVPRKHQKGLCLVPFPGGPLLWRRCSVPSVPVLCSAAFRGPAHVTVPTPRDFERMERPVRAPCCLFCSHHAFRGSVCVLAPPAPRLGEISAHSLCSFMSLLLSVCMCRPCACPLAPLNPAPRIRKWNLSCPLVHSCSRLGLPEPLQSSVVPDPSTPIPMHWRHTSSCS